jgi:hypothetical protein
LASIFPIIAIAQQEPSLEKLKSSFVVRQDESAPISINQALRLNSHASVEQINFGSKKAPILITSFEGLGESFIGP